MWIKSLTDRAKNFQQIFLDPALSWCLLLIFGTIKELKPDSLKCWSGCVQPGVNYMCQ